MPRKPRMYLPGVPCHIIQRGNNRDATFFAEQDYQFFLTPFYSDTDLLYIFFTPTLQYSDMIRRQ
jgi:hypothetical protein